jgi:pimeloyl-ACP methyl ester carboxylesterase
MRITGQRFPPPGTFVDVGGFRLHLHAQGHGSPTVVFDAALGGSSLSWSLVQPRVAEITRTCSYDRAGFGWSDAGPMPRTAGRIADELYTLLVRARMDPPFVLVGHSYGALVMRVFASRHPAEVAGLVLVEPAIAEDWIDPNEVERYRIEHGVRLCRQGARAARLGLARLVSVLVRLGALDAARRIVALVSRGTLRRGAAEMVAPMNKLPPALRPALHHMWTRPQFFDALGSQIETIRQSAREVLDAEPVGNDLPLLVISATEPHPHHVMMQEALARRSSNGRRLVAVDSGHWVPLDDPDTVVDAIVELVDRLRASSGPAPRPASTRNRSIDP